LVRLWQRHLTLRVLWHAYLLWLRTDCIDLSAAFAYHTLQSFFPALLIGLSIASRWLGRDSDLLEQLLHLIGQIIPVSFQPVVEETLTRFLRQGVGAGLLGFLLLAFSANNIYLSLQRGADRLWWNRPLDIESLTARQVVVRFITLRLKALLLLLFVGPLIVLDQWISTIRFLSFSFVRSWIDPLLPAFLRPGVSVSFGLDISISLVIAILVSLALLWWLPSRRIPLAPLLPAAALAGSGITLLNLLLGRSLFALGLRFQAYGVVGCILLFTLWVWFLGAILYYGHCFAVVRSRRLHGRRSTPLASP
jgi:membrane protein